MMMTAAKDRVEAKAGRLIAPEVTDKTETAGGYATELSQNAQERERQRELNFVGAQWLARLNQVGLALVEPGAVAVHHGLLYCPAEREPILNEFRRRQIATRTGRRPGL